MPFMSHPVVEYVDGHSWKLHEPLVYVTRNFRRITVPAGFMTDFASIPRIFWSLVGEPTGKWAPAAAVHDFCYRKRLLSRVEADQLFRDGCIEVGVRRSKAWLLWAAVRVGGWGAYQSSRAPHQSG